jgi:tight adherence protein B
MAGRLALITATSGAVMSALLMTSGVFAAAPLPQQTSGEATIEIESVDVSAFPNVVIEFSTRGATAEASLTSDQLSVNENGILREITDLSKLESEAIEILVIFDRSGSMGRSMPAARAAAQSFVSQLPESVPVGLLSFATDVTLNAPIGTPRPEILRAIANLTAAGNTALYDAVVAGATQFSPTDTRRIIVLLSDGKDEGALQGGVGSVATLEEVIQARLGIIVEVIELRNGSTDLEALTALADPGPVRSVDQASELEGVYREIVQDLLSRYRISFVSRAIPGTPTEFTLGLREFGAAASTVSVIAPGDAPTTTTTTTTTVPQLVESEADELAPDARPWIGAGLVMGGLGATLAGVNGMSRRRVRGRLPSRRASIGDKEPEGLAKFFSAAMKGDKRRDALEKLLQQANVRIPTNRFILFVGGGALAAMILLAPTLGPFSILVAVAVPFVVRSRLRARIEKRRGMFVTQLPDTLQVLSSMLKSGYGFMQSIDAMARESSSPTAEMFDRLLVEVRTGRDVSDAFDRLAEDVQSLDFDWVVAAIDINREIGGDLAQTLDTVAETIRDREKLRGQVKALTAEGRMSAYLMLALPPLVGMFSFISSPEVASVLFEPIGLLVLFVAASLMAIGYGWIRSIVGKVAK